MKQSLHLQALEQGNEFKHYPSHVVAQNLHPE
jgi:hypothetical protein